MLFDCPVAIVVEILLSRCGCRYTWLFIEGHTLVFLNSCRTAASRAVCRGLCFFEIQGLVLLHCRRAATARYRAGRNIWCSIDDGLVYFKVEVILDLFDARAWSSRGLWTLCGCFVEPAVFIFHAPFALWGLDGSSWVLSICWYSDFARWDIIF